MHVNRKNSYDYDIGSGLRRSFVYAIIVGLAIAVSGTQLYAESRLEEIVVTAQKRGDAEP